MEDEDKMLVGGAEEVGEMSLSVSILMRGCVSQRNHVLLARPAVAPVQHHAQLESIPRYLATSPGR